ncbi:MAG: hypothetical protein JNL01_03190 [Bdellovibrionales bacterium]|nr:hypothetical protein [Bdellovibrionales bacterium]
MNLYHDEIDLGSSDGEDEFRMKRLERTIGYVCALGEHFGNQLLLSKIGSLHDHKGVLQVGWKRKPTDGEKEIFGKAWGSLIGDGASENVEHEVK